MNTSTSHRYNPRCFFNNFKTVFAVGSAGPSMTCFSWPPAGCVQFSHSGAQFPPKVKIVHSSPRLRRYLLGFFGEWSVQDAVSSVAVPEGQDAASWTRNVSASSRGCSAGRAGLELAEMRLGVDAGSVLFPTGIAKTHRSKRSWVALWGAGLLVAASVTSCAPVVRCVPDSVYLPCKVTR